MFETFLCYCIILAAYGQERANATLARAFPEETPVACLPNLVDLSSELRTVLLRGRLLGPKRVESLLEALGPVVLLRALAERDEEALSSVPGIGDKLAQRLCKGAAVLAEDLAREYGDVLPSGDRPCFEVLTEDREQEMRVITQYAGIRYGLEADEHTGAPVLVGREVEEVEDVVNVPDAGNCWFVEPWSPELAAEQREQARSRRSDDVVPSEFDHEKPAKQFYSQARPYRAQERNFLTIMCWIHQHKGDEQALRRGWKRFWTRYFAEKKRGDTRSWLFNRQVSSVVAAFKAQGIEKRAGQ